MGALTFLCMACCAIKGYSTCKMYHSYRGHAASSDVCHDFKARLTSYYTHAMLIYYFIRSWLVSRVMLS